MIHVVNMEDAIRFYTQILGLPLVLDAREFNHVEVGPSEPLAKIGMHETGKRGKRKRNTGIVFDTNDIYALYDRLRKLGVRARGVVANFLDPDNNELQVVQDPEHYNREP